MLGFVSSFAALGFGVRCYQLALMKRNIFENLGGHLLSVTAFSALGYGVYQTDIYQRKLIDEKRGQLLRMRERAASLEEEHGEEPSVGHH